MKLVVAGTDTGIGKTVFAASLAVAMDGVYWKPVQAGLEGETDTQTAARLGARTLPEAYRLTLPLSPHLAAEKDSVAIEAGRLVLPEADPLIIEAAGGVLAPLTSALLSADLFKLWNLPVVLCARTSLGTINHSLLSIEALRSRGVPLLGMAFIGDDNLESEDSIARFGKIKRLGRLPWLETLDSATLSKVFADNFYLQDFTP